MVDILTFMDDPTLRGKPEAVKANLVALGTYVCAWRKLHHLTAEALADRANVSRGTLRGIEQGTGAASAANLVAVLEVLGVAERIIAAADPRTNEEMASQIAGLPQRVRGTQRQRKAILVANEARGRNYTEGATLNQYG